MAATAAAILYTINYSVAISRYISGKRGYKDLIGRLHRFWFIYTTFAC